MDSSIKGPAIKFEDRLKLPLEEITLILKGHMPTIEEMSDTIYKKIQPHVVKDNLSDMAAFCLGFLMITSASHFPFLQEKVKEAYIAFCFSYYYYSYKEDDWNRWMKEYEEKVMASKNES